MYVQVPWPPIAIKFTQLFYSLSFNVEVAHPECVRSFNYYEKFEVLLSFPIVVAILLSVLSRYWFFRLEQHSIASDYELSGQYRKKWKVVRQILVIFATSVYSPVCYYSLKFFQPCIKSTDGA